MNQASAQTKIREFLAQDLGVDLSGIAEESPLFTSGVIDSFALLELMAFMESEFQVKIDISEMSIDRLDTIASLTALCDGTKLSDEVN